MRLLKRKQPEGNGEVTEVVVTRTDQAVLAMSGAAERLRGLDAEMMSAFQEWRDVQKRCLEEGLLVEVKMADALRAAYQTWLADQYRSDDDDSAETGVIVTGAPQGAGVTHRHVHGWPLRMMYAGQVTAW
jgi:hypothetical protein